jgi:hypothetical protein
MSGAVALAHLTPGKQAFRPRRKARRREEIRADRRCPPAGAPLACRAIGVGAMHYIETVLQPGERILAKGQLHWIIYLLPGLCALIGLLLIASSGAIPDLASAIRWLGLIFLVIAAIAGFKAWFDQWITEIAVTSLRVIYKRGFIRRRTVEMNMDKVESVRVDQSLFGRLLGYGTIHVLGTGEGITHLHQIADPIALRNAIIVR